MAEPGAPRQTHAFLSRTCTREPILGFGQKTENPSARSQNHPVQPPNTTKQHFYLSKIHLLLFLSLLFSSLSLTLSPPPLCLFVSLSLTHTSNTCTHKQVDTQQKSPFLFGWGNMTVIFGLLLAPLEGEAGVKPTRRGGKKKRLQTQSEGKERKKQTILLITTKGKIIKKKDSSC